MDHATNSHFSRIENDVLSIIVETATGFSNAGFSGREMNSLFSSSQTKIILIVAAHLQDIKAKDKIVKVLSGKHSIQTILTPESFGTTMVAWEAIGGFDESRCGLDMLVDYFEQNHENRVFHGATTVDLKIARKALDSNKLNIGFSALDTTFITVEKDSDPWGPSPAFQKSAPSIEAEINSALDFIHNNKFDLALPVLEKLISLNRSNGDLLLLQAFCEAQMGRISAAIRTCIDAVVFQPTNINAKEFLAQLEELERASALAKSHS
jgi:hypothetical protein